MDASAHRACILLKLSMSPKYNKRPDQTFKVSDIYLYLIFDNKYVIYHIISHLYIYIRQYYNKMFNIHNT